MGGYDPLDPEVLNDPHPANRWLLEQCPVHHHDGMGFTTVSRHADVLDVARDTDRYTAAFGQGPVGRPGGGLFNDPPEHTLFRQMVLSWFTARRMEEQRPVITALAHSLVDAMVDGGRRSAELHDDLACPLPVILVARLLGVAEQDRDRFKVWSDAQVLAMGRADASNKATQQEMHAYLLDGIRSRRAALDAGAELSDDLISGMVRAAAGARRPVGEHEILGVLAQLLVGGNETTTSLITNCLWRLLEEPARWAAVVADPALGEVAVEESLRFDPPVLGLFRQTACPVELHGTTVPAGARVQMNYAAANRDAAVFDDPDTFRLDRDLAVLRRRQLAFGSGVHLCLGAALARSEATIALRVLVERLPGLRLAGPTERIAPWFLWGRHRLPVAW